MQWFVKKRLNKCLISLSNHIGIKTGNRKESESISRIGIEIDKIQTIPNPNCDSIELQSFRTSEQLFVCYRGQQKGKDVSKQRMANWIVDVITLAYEAQGVPCPLRLRAHSTRDVASSWVLSWCLTSRHL